MREVMCLIVWEEVRRGAWSAACSPVSACRVHSLYRAMPVFMGGYFCDSECVEHEPRVVYVWKWHWQQLKQLESRHYTCGVDKTYTSNSDNAKTDIQTHMLAVHARCTCSPIHTLQYSPIVEPTLFKGKSSGNYGWPNAKLFWFVSNMNLYFGHKIICLFLLLHFRISFEISPINCINLSIDGLHYLRIVQWQSILARFFCWMFRSLQEFG